MSDSSAVLLPRISRSCDECKARKVRCIRAQPDSVNCNNCLKRQQKCHFSHTKRKLKVKDHDNASTGPTSLPATHSPGTTATTSAEVSPQTEPPQKLYIDHILETRHAHGVESWRQESSIFKTGEGFIASASLAFFSESRIRSLTERVGHPRLRELIESIGSVINVKMNRGTNEQRSGQRRPPITFKSPPTPEHVAPDAVRAYIAAYFQDVHPMYPFLDRGEFEQKAFSYDLPHNLSSNPAFSALYHTVLALGSQYTEGGSFEAGKGKAWKLYQVALGLLSDVLLPRESLVNLQAITAMAIFALNTSCIQIDGTMISEAARMAQALGYNRSTMNDSAHRNFWVIYTLEKTNCYFSSTSTELSDEDIGCPIPEIPEAVEGGVDWFLLSARFSRITSRAYQMLFTVSATTKTPEQYFDALDIVYHDLEIWRLSIPTEQRPGDPFRPENYKAPWTINVCLKLHCFYYAVVVSLCRLALHIGVGSDSQRMEDAKKRLMYTARQIIEITHYIDIQPHTPIWILGVMPLSALFILFDFVVHNPLHPETSANLASLHVAGIYFNRMDHATGSALPASMVSEFPPIARQFVRDIQTGNNSSYKPPAKQARYSSPVKAYEQQLVNEEQQPVTYIPAQMQGLVVPVQEQQLPHEESIYSVDHLFYPTDDLQPFMTGDFTAGFDMNSLFDSVLPNFQL